MPLRVHPKYSKEYTKRLQQHWSLVQLYLDKVGVEPNWENEYEFDHCAATMVRWLEGCNMRLEAALESICSRDELRYSVGMPLLL